MKAFTTFAGEGAAGGAMREFIAWLEPKSGSIANGLNRIAQDAIAAGKKVVQFVIDIGEGATTGRNSRPRPTTRRRKSNGSRRRWAKFSTSAIRLGGR